MLINTRCFGEINLDENKIVTFESGVMGFESFKQFTILYNVEDDKSKISWLQSIEVPSLALPIINPTYIKEDYNPTVEDEVFLALKEEIVQKLSFQMYNANLSQLYIVMVKRLYTLTVQDLLLR